MIENPDQFIPEFADAGADWIVGAPGSMRHFESHSAPDKQHNCRAGVVINPATPVEDARRGSRHCRLCTGDERENPGFGGQKFYPRHAGQNAKTG